MNVELLNRVKQHILEEPRRLDMDTIKCKVDPTLEKNPPCGTVGCIAGWATILSPDFERKISPEWENEQELLGISQEQAYRLFTEPKFRLIRGEGLGWPADLADAYRVANTAKERAEVTARRIDRFIETNGAV